MSRTRVVVFLPGDTPDRVERRHRAGQSFRNTAPPGFSLTNAETALEAFKAAGGRNMVDETRIPESQRSYYHS